MDRRLKLQTILEEIPKVKKVYFQPPENIQLVYPCIIYVKVQGWNQHADNNKYANRMRYTLTVIDRDPASTISLDVEALPYCSFTSHFITDNLNHDVFSLYF